MSHSCPSRKRLPQHRLHQQLRLLLALGDLRFQGVDGGHEAVDTGDDGLLFGEGGREGKGTPTSWLQLSTIRYNHLLEWSG